MREYPKVNVDESSIWIKLEVESESTSLRTLFGVNDSLMYSSACDLSSGILRPVERSEVEGSQVEQEKTYDHRGGRQISG